jgi:thioredoxin 1
MDELIPYVTDATFDAEVMQASLPVLVCCWSKSINPKFKLNRIDKEIQDEIAKEYAGRMNVVRLNVDENPQTSAKFYLRYCAVYHAHLMLFMNGDILWSLNIHPMSKSQISALIDLHIKLKNGYLMGEQRKKLEIWLTERGDRPSEGEPVKNQLLLIADACDAAIASGKLSEEQAGILLDGILTPHSTIWYKTAELISLLDKKGVAITPVLSELAKSTEEKVRILVSGGILPPALQAENTELLIRLLHNHGNGVDVTPILHELYNSKKAKFRQLALLCIEREAISLPITDEILITELTRKGKSAPLMAASIASCTFRKLWLLPLLELAAEKHPAENEVNNAYTMDVYVKLLRDGYTLTKNQEHASYRIRFVSLQGHRSWRDITISEYANLNASIEAKGIDVAMQEIIKCFNDDLLRQSKNKTVRLIPVEEHRTIYAT